MKEGDSTVIEVPFTASPQPKVRWTLNKNPIEISDRVKVDTINDITSLSLGRIKLKDAGNYKLSLENPHGSVSLDVKLKVIGKPSAPQNLKIKEVTHNSVTLTWSPPMEDGGSSIICYRVEKRDPKRKMYTQVGETDNCEFKVTRLFEGNEYVFQVTAENDIGIGEAAELSQGITPQSPYGRGDSLAEIFLAIIELFTCSCSWCSKRSRHLRRLQQLDEVDLGASYSRWRNTNHWIQHREAQQHIQSLGVHHEGTSQRHILCGQ
jgi:hypothetical protein